MKQSNFLRTIELFPGSEIVRKYSFKSINSWDNYALLARANPNIAMKFAISREKSALFQDKDCFECLSPHKIAV